MDAIAITENPTLQSRRGNPMGTRALILFLALTFGLTWGLAALAILFTDQIVAIFGEVGLSNPLVIYRLQMMNPLWPDAQPYDSFILIGVAVLVVWLNRSSMFQRDGAITDVLMPSDMSD